MSLFDPCRLGPLVLRNRIAMAPLTRNRAGAGNVATAMMAEYYAQRAAAGLIIAEGSQICPEGQGYIDTPGIHDAAQVAAWRQVTGAVHAHGGHIFLQLWHVGRVSHVSLQPGGRPPVAPSAIRAEASTFVADGFQPVSPPRPLAIDEIPGIVEAYRRAASNAIAAGFDGVELHAANGYLIEQFLKDGANKRTDAYGGSIENRARFLVEVMRAVASEIGCERTGVRLSPVTPSNGISESAPVPLFEHVIDRLNEIGPAYLHVVEGATGGPRDIDPNFDFKALRARFRGTYIANNGYDRAMAEAAVAIGDADMVAFGRPFIANPDLVERLRRDAPLNPLDRTTLYGGGAKGYLDYPVLEAAG